MAKHTPQQSANGEGEHSFRVRSARTEPVDGFEVRKLLTQAYVGGGFTDPEVAKLAFEPDAVKQRGELLFVKHPESGSLVGVVVVVPPSSSARRLAQANEAELHLLATSPQHRGMGIGARLLDVALARAKHQRYEAMVLWTQCGMLAAQRLYERHGFCRVPEQDFTAHGRQFWVYRAELS